MASVGERPKQSDIDKGKDKNYEEYRQAVLAARLKFAAVGAPACPGFLIFSPEPFLILRRLA